MRCRCMLQAVVAPQGGDIGEPVRHIELEPLETPSVPSAPVAPAVEPEPVPA